MSSEGKRKFDASSLVSSNFVSSNFVSTFSILIFALLSACADGGGLHDTRCETPCYTGPEHTDGVGICRRGAPVCTYDDSGTVLAVECRNEILPRVEMCNGIDDDCDGSVDDDVVDSGVGLICDGGFVPFESNFTSQCRHGILECTQGALVCVGLQGPAPEICDGIDNNCDGQIDEGLASVAVCYDGDPADLSAPNTACRAGVMQCRSGALHCVGQVKPSLEVCDHLDNDCDGIIDDVATSSVAIPVDIVFIIDISGSMTDKLAHIRDALLPLMLAHASDVYQYAVVFIPAPSQDGAAEILIPLGPASSATTTITNLVTGTGGVEVSYDAAMQCVDGTFALGWRKDSIHIIALFGDEEAQTALGYTETDVATALSDAHAIFYAFIWAAYTEDYDDITYATGGRIFSVVSPVVDLTLEFTRIITSGCLP